MISTEYMIFVMQAYLAGQEIEYTDRLNESEFGWWVCNDQIGIDWNWNACNYRIKLPDGWEYVIEDNEIAFRPPKKGEGFLPRHTYVPIVAKFDMDWKRPIIRRSK